MKKKYLGFTLIEMLIVMGIMIILMAAGIAGGRFAIQRANRIQKQSAIRNLYQASMGFYTDMRRFPQQATPRQLINEEGFADSLAGYLDTGAFDGGVEGPFWYWVLDGTQAQEVLFCAQFTNDPNQGGGCEGNGFNSSGLPAAARTVIEQDMDGPEWQILLGVLPSSARSNWDPDNSTFTN